MELALERDTVGFVGLGNVGRHMAANLVAAGWNVIVHDAEPGRAEAFAAEHDAVAVDHPRQLASTRTVVTMLPNGDVVREVILESGLADELAPGSLVLDTSSSDPVGTRSLGDELAKRKVILVDAGVSMPVGGRASERMLTFMVGADDDAAFERAREFLDAMGNRIFRLGPRGAGHAMKTLNNYIGASGLAAALDALIIGAREGLDPAMMLEALNVSTGRNFNTQFPLRDRAVKGHFDSGYALALLVKDLRIAKRYAERSTFESPLFAVLEREYREAWEALGGGSVDHLAALRHWEQRAGVQVAAVPAPDDAP
ncbi:MAG: NAD(P)-dependent oxidoreductase [Conexibacteraceae bacterium]|nr:NAD(P)-dependent oxidoreductase [Conexibacteraceae bacterium]